MRVPPLFIAIPAWGTEYVALAVKYTIPAVLASLARSPFKEVTFRIDTDQPGAFNAALQGYEIDFGVMASRPRERDNWTVFKDAHARAIKDAPHGSICALLNSDIVVSIETFDVVAKALQDKKVVASYGIRANVDRAVPPIGVSADDLFAWIWQHRHPIIEELIWGTGKSGLPTMLFFDDKAGNVSMCGFYAVPMFFVKDRNFAFKNTIDDDLMAAWRDDEIHFMHDGAAAFAELSPAGKRHPVSPRAMTVQSLVAWAGRGRLKSQIRSFRQEMRVMGRMPAPVNPVIEAILAGTGPGK